MSRRARWAALAGDPRLRWGTAGALVVVVAGGFALELPASLVLVLALTVLALAVVARLVGSAELGWSPRRTEASSHGWVGVAMLSHSLAVADSSPWEFDRAIQPRLTRLATAALIREGVDWDTPRAREILGTTVHDALRPDAEPIGTPASNRTALAGAALDALTRLEHADPTASKRPTT